MDHMAVAVCVESTGVPIIRTYDQSFFLKSFESHLRDDPLRFLFNWVVIMALMFERLIFGGAHIEVLIKAWLILKVGLMDAQY